MNRLDIDNILKHTLEIVKAHEIDVGKYSRWLWNNGDCNNRDLECNPYGCADAANILYTLNQFPSDAYERKKWIEVLQGFQNSKTGIFYEATHHEFHTTAHCIAALELFDAYPLYPLSKMGKYKDFKEFCKMCEEMDWLRHGRTAHQAAGLYAAFVITNCIDNQWVQNHFEWFDKNCDCETGMWINKPDVDYLGWHQIADSFHFLFNYEHAKHPIPYPEKLIDSCIYMYRNKQMPTCFGKQFHFIEVDWVYCLNRASRQTPHRFFEVKEILYEFAKDYIDFLKNVDWKTHDEANDMHLLFGTICCLAELQLALPGKIHSSRPLRMVLDRRPFI